MTAILRVAAFLIGGALAAMGVYDACTAPPPAGPPPTETTEEEPTDSDMESRVDPLVIDTADTADTGAAS